MLWLMATLSFGCGEEIKCGPGTHLDGTACVANAWLQCGVGTTLADGACTFAADAGDDTSATNSDTSDDGGGDTGVAVDGDAAGDGDQLDSDDAVTCTPFCVGRVCGPDGCGGTCGSCIDPAQPLCDETVGKCAAKCVPQCSGKSCGPDGCGGSCGACAAGATCNQDAVCLPDAWTCTAAWYGDGAVCDCGCGAADVDCSAPKLPIAGCGPLQVCDATGACSSKVPAGWTCAASTYAAVDACNCGCGVPDPDCKYSSLAVVGCKGLDPVCQADGTCGACQPQCTGKECGGDGCGGSCGECADAKAVCSFGKCVLPCAPKPLACETAQCGDDGCGGSCGTCKEGSSCKDGMCVVTNPAPDPTSCVGHCGSSAPAGCYCVASCKKSGTCCADYADICECKPACDGKSCGSDGCGGTCGSCPSDKPHCNASQQCDATCQPACDGKACGDDGCGGSCGTCGAGASCSKASTCVPSGWTCNPLWYGDKLGCDCGCGAIDSDCAVADAPLFGCPSAAKGCTSAGVCDVSFCAANGQCGNQWCIGLYAKGDGSWAGTCGWPISGAKGPGVGCELDQECATQACVQQQCRVYCGADSDCAATELCVGLATPAKGLGAVPGFAAVCDLVPGSHKPCASQAACAESSETCIALTDAKTHAPRLVCALVGTVAPGASCAAAPCAPGLTCADTGKAFVCTLPCPAGDADCPAGYTCGQLPFNAAGTATPLDDPKVALCVPK